MVNDQDSLSVLVVDNTPQIQVFLAGVLQSNDIRPLLAFDSQEAFGIAQSACVPIDLVLVNIVVPGLDPPQLVNRLSEIRPGLRALYMSARLDDGVIRVELMPEGTGAFVTAGAGETDDLIQSIRSASRSPLACAAGANRYRVNGASQ